MCAGSSPTAGSSNPPASSAAVMRPRQLQQGKRVPAGLSDDPVHDAAVEPAGHDARAAVCGHLAPAALRDATRADPSKSGAAAGSRTATTMATDSARTRRATSPRIWLEAASSHCASSTRHSSGRSSATAASRLSTASPTRNRFGHFPGCKPQSDAQGVSLRDRECVEPVEHRRAELMDPGERQLHLRLHGRELRDSEAGCLPRGVAQQGGLADARLAADDQDARSRLREPSPASHRALRARWSGPRNPAHASVAMVLT